MTENYLHQVLPGELEIHIFLKNLICLRYFWVKEKDLNHDVIYLLLIVSL